MKCRLKLKQLKKRKAVKKWNLERLRDQKSREEYSESLDRELRGNAVLPSIKNERMTIREKIFKACEDKVWFRKAGRKTDWITDEIPGLMEERRKFRNSKKEEGDKRHRKLRNAILKKCTKAKELWIKGKCDAIVSESVIGRIDSGYRKIREYFGTTKLKSRNLKDSLGKSLLRSEGKADRWKEYIEQLYKGDEMDEYKI